MLIQYPAMNTDNSHHPLDYATPVKRGRKRLKVFAISVCILAAVVLVWIIIAGGAP
jgi:hypothetical protein